MERKNMNHQENLNNNNNIDNSDKLPNSLLDEKSAKANLTKLS